MQSKTHKRLAYHGAIIVVVAVAMLRPDIINKCQAAPGTLNFVTKIASVASGSNSVAPTTETRLADHHSNHLVKTARLVQHSLTCPPEASIHPCTCIYHIPNAQAEQEEEEEVYELSQALTTPYDKPTQSAQTMTSSLPPQPSSSYTSTPAPTPSTAPTTTAAPTTSAAHTTSTTSATSITPVPSAQPPGFSTIQSLASSPLMVNTTPTPGQTTAETTNSERPTTFVSPTSISTTNSHSTTPIPTHDNSRGTPPAALPSSTVSIIAATQSTQAPISSSSAGFRPKPTRAAHSRDHKHLLKAQQLHPKTLDSRKPHTINSTSPLTSTTTTTMRPTLDLANGLDQSPSSQRLPNARRLTRFLSHINHQRSLFSDQGEQKVEVVAYCRNIQNPQVLSAAIKGFRGHQINYFVIDSCKVPPFPNDLFHGIDVRWLEMLNTTVQFHDNFLIGAHHYRHLNNNHY